ncbi:MAG: FKBP-type peptidyl-prolyl cis-trans isomerase [Verrucomicrobiae bacterium]|nr:FKBP-type peptidyl-prolyl cis-trans isomerase [Verrucomicrobiae bacterium]NNJ42310.1 FKBP-type peptidyl-prolyl cis-trans isomerase [Akkermansiaceae bacterium]
MKNNNITSYLGVIGFAGLASFAGVVTLSAQAPAPGAPPAAPAGPKLTAAEVKNISSYVLGLQSSSRFAGAGLTVDDIDSAAVIKGFLAGLKGEKPEYPEAKLRAAMEALGKMVQGREAKKGEANLAAGNAFLAENAKKKGVITNPSGLQYEVINKGTDQKYVAPANGAPDGGTQFMVHYRGTLIDGSEFDKSPEGQAFPMTLQVIPGFKEALTTMPVGAKWRLFLPAALAYGPRAAGPKIGPNSALIFELELVEIKAAPAPVPAPPVPAPRPRASAVTPPVQVPAPAPAK